jgi:hypothetical protein
MGSNTNRGTKFDDCLVTAIISQLRRLREAKLGRQPMSSTAPYPVLQAAPLLFVRRFCSLSPACAQLPTPVPLEHARPPLRERRLRAISAPIDRDMRDDDRRRRASMRVEGGDADEASDAGELATSRRTPPATTCASFPARPCRRRHLECRRSPRGAPSQPARPPLPLAVSTMGATAVVFFCQS